MQILLLIILNLSSTPCCMFSVYDLWYKLNFNYYCCWCYWYYL